MPRLTYSLMFAFCLSIVSFTAVGCGESNTVIEDTRSEADVVQEEEDYEKQMQEMESSDISK
ncbi:hypothetical protein [Planctomycetes bacterium K23_9]|uniref:Secreted protein n=1 Tax=Stieleria marina TaxID=1930275 RepID=A0A517NQM1_9BACT|nr:hypothetical protein K239x_13610 [Planctomycetes bacterium K23_9]